MDEIHETTPTDNEADYSAEELARLEDMDPEAFERGLESFGEVLSTLPGRIMAAAEAVGKFNRKLSALPRNMERNRIERINGFAMDEGSLLARRTGMGNRVIKAKKAKSLGDVVRSREPRFMCPEHRERLVFSKLNQVWECPSPGCNKRKLPSMDRTDTTIIKSAPRVVGRQDEDGDIHWYLNFMEENIMVELPFQSTSAMAGARSKSISLTYTTDDNVVFGPNGEQLDLAALTEAEPDTI